MASRIPLQAIERVGSAGQPLLSGGAGVPPSYGEPPLPFAYLAGYGMANNSGTPTTHIDIAVGAARDSTNAANITLASAITKRLDVVWAVGTGNGGLDTGARAANTWYHVHAIRRPDTGVVDALFSLSATAPTLPANYTQFRRIGSIRTDGSSNILAFVQDGDRFAWSVPAQDFSSAPGVTTAVLQTLRVPTGVNVTARIAVVLQSDTVSGVLLLLTDPAQADTVPSLSCFTGFANDTDAASNAFTVEVRTNTSGQIRQRQTVANRNVTVVTHGWIDTRGRA